VQKKPHTDLHESTLMEESAEISDDECLLSKHRGCWVAFSPDGRRLIASGISLATLDAQVRAAGENPEEVLLERVPDGDCIVAGSELS
jgi:hypothetical protein